MPTVGKLILYAESEWLFIEGGFAADLKAARATLGGRLEA
jgi:hypothetical protein